MTDYENYLRSAGFKVVKDKKVTELDDNQKVCVDIVINMLKNDIRENNNLAKHLEYFLILRGLYD